MFRISEKKKKFYKILFTTRCWYNFCTYLMWSTWVYFKKACVSYTQTLQNKHTIIRGADDVRRLFHAQVSDLLIIESLIEFFERVFFVRNCVLRHLKVRCIYKIFDFVLGWIFEHIHPSWTAGQISQNTCCDLDKLMWIRVDCRIFEFDSLMLNIIF